jgi:hypothetical protein
MKIGEYEQMMSWLTRPEAPTPIEPRENLKGGTDPKTGMGFQKGNTMGQGRAKDLIGKPSINVEGKNQHTATQRTAKEIQAIIDANPDYITPKNFYQPTDIMKKKGMKKLLTQSDVKNPDVIFQKKGKDPADPEKQTARNTKRKESILRQEGRQYNVKAPKGYQVHHMLPLAGNVDINTGDLAVISKKMNAKMSKYDKQINRLTTEATLLDFSKKNSLDRLDDINEKLNNVLKTIKKDLPKKYKGLIGFNKLTPVFDEYGTVLDLTAEPVGIDYKKSIAGSKGLPTRDVKTSEIQKLVNNAPKLKAALLPGLEEIVKGIKNIPDDIAKKRYFTLGLKALGPLGTYLAVNDTYEALKEGKSVAEALEYGLIGTNVIGSTKDVFALSPEEREARSVVKQAEMANQISQDESLLDTDFETPAIESDLSIDEAEKKYKAGQESVRLKREAEEADIARARAVSVEGLKDLMLGKRFEPAEIPQEFFAIGGRVGFADGSDPKDPKMNRRTFMKVMGGLASIPLLGKFIKPAAKVAESAAPVVKETLAGAPDHFWNLVAKIKTFGDDITQFGALAERQSVKKYKDFELTEDMATGQIEIQRVKVAEDMDYYGSPVTEESYMSYRPGEVVDEVKGIKSAPDYEEGTTYIRNDGPETGNVLDEVSGVSDDIFEEAGVPVPEAIRKK